jgi:rhodanese-related sulfurtransferase
VVCYVVLCCVGLYFLALSFLALSRLVPLLVLFNLSLSFALSCPVFSRLLNLSYVYSRGPGELEIDPKIDGAVNVSCTMASFERDVDKAIASGVIPADKSTPIVAYCAVGGRSETCLQRLAELGYTDLVNGINTDQMKKALG